MLRDSAEVPPVRIRKTTPRALVHLLLRAMLVVAILSGVGVLIDGVTSSGTTVVIRDPEDPFRCVSLGVRYGGVTGYPYVLWKERDQAAVMAELSDRLPAFRRAIGVAGLSDAGANVGGADPRAEPSTKLLRWGAVIGFGMAVMVVWGAFAVHRSRSRQGILASYALDVRQELERLYEKCDTYSLARVERGIEEAGVSRRYEVSAFALYCSKTDFLLKFVGEPVQYEQLRSEMLGVQRRVVSAPWGGGRVGGNPWHAIGSQSGR
jgi:hypothetical protein